VGEDGHESDRPDEGDTMVPTRRLARRPVPGLVLGAAVAASLVLTGCASGTDGGGGDETSGAATTDPGTDGSTTAEPTGDPADDATLAPDAATMAVEAGAHGRGLPPGVDGSAEGGTGAAWSAEPGLLYVVTYGSSTCPLLAEPEATAQGAEVSVTFVEVPADAVCTMDLVPATSVVAVPDDVDASADVTAVLGTHGTVVVPPAVEGATGEAAWVEQ